MTTNKIVRYLDIFSYFLILVTVILTPLLFSTALSNAFTMPKQYVFIGMVLLLTFLFALKTVLLRQFYYRQSALDIPILALLGIALLSSLFSKDLYNSFLGRNEYFLLNFVLIAFLVLFFFIIINTITNKSRWSMIVDSVLAVGGAGAVLFLVKNVFNYSLPYFGLVYNTVSSSNIGFGIWLAVIMVLSVGYLMKKNTGVIQSVFYGVVVVLSGAGLLAIGFKSVWWAVLVGLSLLLLFGISFVSKVRIWSLSLIFALLIVNVVFLIYNSPKSLQVKLPIEIALGAKPSWSITNQTVFNNVKNFLIGSGLGSFATDFSKFRNVSFNYDSFAWSLRFNSPFNTFFALLSEGGVLFILLYIFILFLVLGYVFSSWSKSKQARDAGLNYDINNNSLFLSSDDFDLDIYLILSAWLVLWTGMIFVFFGPILWIMWWLMLGLLMSGLYVGGYRQVKIRQWILQDVPQYNLAFSFSLIVIMALVVMFVVVGSRFLQAELAYKKALQSKDQTVVNSELNKAILARAHYDNYHVAQARYYLNLAISEAQKKEPNISNVTQLVAAAVNEAKIASNLSPNQVSTWENLAVMYENATALVPQAGEWAIKSLETATKLEPSNAYLQARLARNYLQNKNEDKAIMAYQKSITLKRDYAGSYISLAYIYEQKKDLKQAIKVYEQGIQNKVQTVDFLFNYGRVLYNNNQGDDRQKAESLWKIVLRYQPNYSNAWYSLGLLYEAKGNMSQAIKYYQKVKKLNPKNIDIDSKLKSLTKVVVPKTNTSSTP